MSCPGQLKKLLANSLCLYHDHMHGGSSNNDVNENGGVDDDDYLNGGSASRASSASGHNLTFLRSQSARDTTRRMSSRCIRQIQIVIIVILTHENENTPI